MKTVNCLKMRFGASFHFIRKEAEKYKYVTDDVTRNDSTLVVLAVNVSGGRGGGEVSRHPHRSKES